MVENGWQVVSEINPVSYDATVYDVQIGNLVEKIRDLYTDDLRTSN